ncbi:MAG: M20/M25/M40 family metallo-hydrolase [Candidatus Korobacteraceae bacterium]
MTLRFCSRIAAALLILAIAVPADVLAATATLPNTETVNWEVMSQIRNEGFHNSKVMEIEGQLTDVIGPRLTGSPNMKRANEWTRDQFTEWGLVNSHLESFPFGRGWSNEYTEVRMVAPQASPLLAYPKAWTVSTNGAVRAPVVKAKLATQADLDKYKGQLSGKIVLNGDMREITPGEKPALKRYDDKDLADLSQYQIPSEKPRFNREETAQRVAFQKTLNQFLMDEHVAAIIDPSRAGEAGLVFVQSGASYEPNTPAGVPSLVMAIENYGRITRLLDRNIPVELELDVRNTFYDSDPNAYNTVAEIPGTDKKDELVMLGAHLDSWHAGTGATDNAAGSAITMEAIRILKAIGFKPRRTIRVALWSGEEEGLLGSAAYVKDHFGSHAAPTDPKELAMPEWLRKNDTPLNLKPEQAKVSAYFNVDNGTGKLRGVYLQENEGVAPIFSAWMQPFNDLGMTTLTMRNTGGTDHESFDAVGIPGFQFIQDPVEYMTRTHHSNEDVYERIQRDDMMQAAVILAAYVYDAAMRDNMLPRKPLPKPAPAAAPAPAPKP